MSKKKEMNPIKFMLSIIISLVLLLAIVPIIADVVFNKAPEGSLVMELSMSGFTPSVVEAKVGEEVQIYLVNLDNEYHKDGGGWHQFKSDQLGFDYKIGPENKQLITLTVNEPGEYDFYCDVCCGGKENPYMQGKLIITV